MKHKSTLITQYRLYYQLTLWQWWIDLKWWIINKRKLSGSVDFEKIRQTGKIYRLIMKEETIPYKEIKHPGMSASEFIIPNRPRPIVDISIMGNNE